MHVIGNDVACVYVFVPIHCDISDVEMQCDYQYSQCINTLALDCLLLKTQ